MAKKALIMYVPNLHAGYGKLINDVSPKTIYLLDDSVIAALIRADPTPEKERSYLERSFPYAWEAKVIEPFVQSLGSWRDVMVMGEPSLTWMLRHSILAAGRQVVMPDEDVSRYFYEDYLVPLGIECEFSNKVFLRYNQRNAEAGSPPFGQAIVSDHLDEPLASIVRTAAEYADRSDDWWRQVGAVLFDEASGEILLAGYNKHLPDGHHRYAYGDARSSFKAGYKPELVTAIHAEQNMFMQALKRGVSTAGKSLYVSTYPCPGCSNMIALSGIKRVYYSEGYSVMDQGRHLFDTYGVETICLHPEAMKKAAT